MFCITIWRVLLDCVSRANCSLPFDEALIAAMNLGLPRESLHLLPIHNEVAVVDLELVNQLRDELLPDAVVSSKTGNS